MSIEKYLHSIKSDDLSNLRSLLDKYGAFLSSIAPIFQLKVIVDANVIIGDLIWLTKHRKKRNAQTALQELIKAETVIAHAPTILEVEVKKHLSAVAKKYGINEEYLQAEWQSYANCIEFTDVPNVSSPLVAAVRDPNDIPYLTLQRATSAPIYTRDKDIPAMGGATVNYTVIAKLQEYSRSAAVEYTIKSQGIVIAVISGKIVEQLFSFVRSLTAGAKKLPSWVWLFAGATVVIALLNPKIRNMMTSWVSSLPNKAQKFGMQLIKLTEPIVHEHQRAKEMADKALEAVNFELKELNV